MLESIFNIFSTQGFMPHGHCYLWQPPLVWLQVLSNATIALAYFSISAALIYFVRRRADLAFNWIFVLFSSFILACGTTHVVDVFTIWNPIYWTDGIIRAVTGIVSLATALVLWPLIPKALKLPSTKQLEVANESLAQEVARRREAEEGLLKAHAELEKKIEKRTLQLAESEARYRTLIEGARDVAIFSFNNDGIITEWNPGAEAIFRYSEQEAIGLQIDRLFTPEDLAVGMPQMEMGHARSNELTPDVRWHLRKDGSKFWASGSCNALFDRNGGPIGYVMVLTDNTKMKLNELALRESEARFRATFAQEAVGIMHVDEDTRFIRVNCRYCNMVGYSAEELASLTIFDLIHPDDQKEEKQLRAKLWSGEIASFSSEKRYIRKDGSIFWVQMTAALAEDPVARRKYSIQVVQDIHEKKKSEEALRESELRFRQLTENIREVFWIFDVGKMESIYFSPACEMVYGRTAEQLQKDFKQNLHRVHEEDRPLVEDNMFRQLRGEETAIEFRYHRNNEMVWLSLKSFPIRNTHGKIYRIAGITEDITVRKQVEEELLLAKQAAEAANRSKSAFLANMSHEIRTPLNAIVGFSELLLGQALGVKERAEYVATIQRSGQVLAQLIDDILDLSKVEAGKLQVEWLKVSVPGMIQDIVALFGKQASDKDISLDAKVEGSIPSTITSDPTRLRQILFNIVGNAIKFTTQGSVEIIMRYETVCEKENEGRLHFMVRDSGRGMSLDEQERLFKAFSQADVSTTRNFGGTGLGLQLSRRLAQILGGDIILTESVPGKGSIFTISVTTGNLMDAKFISSLDAKGFNNLPWHSSSVPQHELEGLRILVAEDAPDNQALIQKFLEMHGAEKIEVVENGKEAINKVYEDDFDIVLMDIQMPVLDGYSATEELRRRGVRMPIVALTAHAMREQREQSVKAGFSGYITKPVNKDLLIKTVTLLAGERHH